MGEDEKRILFPEKVLVRRLKEGDEEAFEQLYYRYSEKLYYFSLRFLKTREDAEGLVQDTFIKIWENRENLRPHNSFNSFVFTIARNAIFNLNRKKFNEEAYKQYLKYYLDEHYDKTSNDAMINELKQRIATSIEKLPKQRKLIFQMSKQQGMPYKEIAQELNVSVKTVEAHMRLALKQVRSNLKNDVSPAMLVAIVALSVA